MSKKIANLTSQPAMPDTSMALEPIKRPKPQGLDLEIQITKVAAKRTVLTEECVTMESMFVKIH